MTIIRIVETLHQTRKKMGEEFQKLYDGELNPVAPKAQRKVPVPEGLDLDSWIGDEWVSSGSESEDEDSDVEATFGAPITRPKMEFGGSEEEEEEGKEEKRGKKGKKKEKGGGEMTKEEMERKRKEREAERESNPYYVKVCGKIIKS